MDVSLFDFDLPDGHIALRPASPRDSSKLLQVGASALFDHLTSELPNLLKAGDVLVANNTKVIKASLTGIRKARAYGGGGDVSVQINLHKAAGGAKWRAFARPAKRLKIGDKLSFSDDLSAQVTDKSAGGDVGLDFNMEGAALDAAIAGCGTMPLPPYIAKSRPVDDQDDADYQTVFAADEGSVAAPTAGLHFTPSLLQALKQRGVEVIYLTLHVGAGTFLPVSAEDTGDHKMHAEWYEIDADTADFIGQAKSEGRRIIAVGTTALRALESSARGDGSVKAEARETEIFITPGYPFQIVDGLMTNFHLPRSTLFMLVCAFAGMEVMQEAYTHAVESQYRFYSYGDASLLWRAKS